MIILKKYNAIKLVLILFVIISLVVVVHIVFKTRKSKNINSDKGLCDVKQHHNITYDKDIILLSLKKARDGILKEKKITPDIIWLLNKVNIYWNDYTLKKFIDVQRDMLVEERIALIINPKAKKIKIPPYIERGNANILASFYAPFSEPENEAIKYIEHFMLRDGEEGYILTHQILVFEWAKEQHLRIPHELDEREKVLLENLRTEQCRNYIYSDIFAERAMILVLYYDYDRKELSGWVDLLIKEQNANGLWIDETKQKIVIEKNEFTIGKPSTTHITALSMVVLAVYYSIL